MYICSTSRYYIPYASPAGVAMVYTQVQNGLVRVEDSGVRTSGSREGVAGRYHRGIVQVQSGVGYRMCSHTRECVL